jgi:hypothetical protein
VVVFGLKMNGDFDGKNVFFRGMKITNCPFCGKKIELTREC